MSYWANIDKSNPLVSIIDLNHDGIVQLSEINLDGDMIMLAGIVLGLVALYWLFTAPGKLWYRV